MTVLKQMRYITPILFATLLLSVAGFYLIGCADSKSGNGPLQPGDDSCADVGGSWSIALVVEDGWWGPVVSSCLQITQTDDCEVTGSMAMGAQILGQATADSLYLTFGMGNTPAEEWTQCALKIVDDYLMTGIYVSVDGAGPVSLHGADPDCGGVVTLEISSGLVPVFDWEPECRVSLILIESVDSGSDQWMVGNENENAIEPDLTYGEAPDGVYSGPAAPLQPGGVYRVIMYRWLGEEDAYLMVSYEEFAP